MHSWTIVEARTERLSCTGSCGGKGRVALESPPGAGDRAEGSAAEDLADLGDELLAVDRLGEEGLRGRHLAA